MVATATRMLPVGLALAGAVLATTGLPGTGATSAQAAPAAAVVRTTAPAPVAPAAPRPSRVTSVAVPAAAAKAPAATAPRTPVRASRATASTCSGPGWEQRRGQAALRSLQPAAASGYALRFAGARAGFYGLTRPSLQAIEVYVRSCSAQTDELLRHVIAHELGHAHDKTRLSDAQRAAYKKVRGIPDGTPWFGCHRCTDFATPAGDFAEVYAQWRRGAATNRSQLGGAPSSAQLEVLAQRFFGA